MQQNEAKFKSTFYCLKLLSNTKGKESGLV